MIKKRSSKKKDEFKDRKAFGDAKVEVKLFFSKRTYSINILYVLGAGSQEGGGGGGKP